MVPDGTIVINTKINTQGFESGQKKMEAAAQRTASRLKTLNSRLSSVMTAGSGTSAFNAPTHSAEQYSEAVGSAANKNSKFTVSLNKLRSNLQDTHKDFSKGLKGILRYGFGIETLFALFRKLRQATTEGFQNLAKYDSTTNKSLSSISSSLTRLKNSLATAFAPIVNYVAPILTKFIDLLSSAATYVGMFFAAITGQKTFTKAIAVQTDYAASLGDTASAANKAKKALENLSGLDEIHKWQSDTSGSAGGASGGGSGGSSGAGTMFETVELPFKDVDWKFVGSSISDGLIKLLDFISDGIESVEWGEIPNDIVEAISGVLEGFDWSGSFESVGRLIGTGLGAAIDFGEGVYTEIQEAKGELGEYFMWYIHDELSILDEDATWSEKGAAIARGILTGMLDGLLKTKQWIKTNVTDPFISGIAKGLTSSSSEKELYKSGKSTASKVMDGMSDTFADTDTMSADVQENTRLTWSKIEDTISSTWTKIKSYVKTTSSNVKSTISSAWQNVKDKTSEKWSSIKADVASKVENVREKVSSTWSNIKSDTASKWESIKSNLSEKWNSIRTNASQRFSEIGTSISNSWNNTKNAVIEKVENLKTSLSNAWANIKDKASNGFSKLKESVTNIMNSLKNALKTPINGIIGFLNKMLSGLVSGVNNAISALNKISVKIPSWVPGIGGKTFGFNIKTISTPQIPYLATGAVIPPNAPFVAMLGDQRRGNNLEAPESLIRQIVREESGGSGNIYNVTARANGRTIFEMVIEEGRRQQTTTGRNPFELVY